MAEEKEDLLIYNARIYTKEGVLDRGFLVIRDGKIVRIGTGESGLGRDGADKTRAGDAGDGSGTGKAAAGEVRRIDAGGCLVLPGGIDTHVHFRDPGHSERESFYTGTQSAAAGGTTTVFEHPISNPPQYSPEILKRRIEIAAPQAVVDYGFLGAAGYDHLEEIVPLAREGIFAYKTFLDKAPAGREDEFEGLTMPEDGALIKGMEQLSKSGLICFIHAENPHIIEYCRRKLKQENRCDYQAHALSRPPLSETEAVSRVIDYAKLTGARIQFAHISTPEAMELIKGAKKSGMEVYAETCPHYLFLTEETLKEQGPFAKCNPPLRSQDRVERMWEYINDGTVDVIGSDHGPFLPEEKLKGINNIFMAPAGFPGVDLRVPLMIDAVNRGKLPLETAVKLLAENAAKIYKIPGKGSIEAGADADLLIIDMNGAMKINKDAMYSKSKQSATVYDGWELNCRIRYTILRGKIIARDGVVDESAKGYGKLLVSSGGENET